MNTTRSFQVEVCVCEPMSTNRMCYRYEIDPVFHKEMLPVCETDIPMMAMANREDMPSVAKLKREDRDGLAKRLAHHIADALIRSMGKNDTMNGYPIK